MNSSGYKLPEYHQVARSRQNAFLIGFTGAEERRTTRTKRERRQWEDEREGKRSFNILRSAGEPANRFENTKKRLRKATKDTEAPRSRYLARPSTAIPSVAWR